MKFRPCIDIHNGKVKQIVGGSLRDAGSEAQENFVAEKEASFYARMYQRDGLAGGHVIVLNPAGSEYYEASRNQAFGALEAYPGGLQFGGGVNDRNAKEYVERGASHVIVTSYVFRDGRIQEENLKRLMDAVGRERLVLDLSCRKRDGAYYIVTDRWQRFTGRTGHSGNAVGAGPVLQRISHPCGGCGRKGCGSGQRTSDPSGAV